MWGSPWAQRWLINLGCAPFLPKAKYELDTLKCKGCWENKNLIKHHFHSILLSLIVQPPATPAPKKREPQQCLQVYWKTILANPRCKDIRSLISQLICWLGSSSVVIYSKNLMKHLFCCLLLASRLQTPPPRAGPKKRKGKTQQCPQVDPKKIKKPYS